MRPIENYDNLQAAHGRRGAFQAGTYVMRILSCKEVTTGYGNQALDVVFDVAEGPEAGRFADIAYDSTQDWRHHFEVDMDEMGGARVKTLLDAVMASNPGWAILDWDTVEERLAGCLVGITLQARLVTGTRGKAKGKTRTYLDFWDALPVAKVRAGDYEDAPVNDQRDPAAKAQDRPKQTPQAPAAYQPQAPTAPTAPAYQQPVPTAYGTPQAYQPAPQQAQMPMAQPAPVAYQQPTYPQAPAASVYDEDVPF